MRVPQIPRGLFGEILQGPMLQSLQQIPLLPKPQGVPAFSVRCQTVSIRPVPAPDSEVSGLELQGFRGEEVGFFVMNAPVENQLFGGGISDSKRRMSESIAFCASVAPFSAVTGIPFSSLRLMTVSIGMV